MVYVPNNILSSHVNFWFNRAESLGNILLLCSGDEAVYWLIHKKYQKFMESRLIEE